MKKYYIKFTLIIFSITFLASCFTKEEKEMTEDELFESVNLADSLGLDTGEIRVYALPTPLQVSAALNTYNITYSEDILLPISSSPLNYTSSFQKAINLGINIIDMGYTTVYNRHQRGLMYFKNVEQLMDELGIISREKQPMLKRFENNFDNQDSLYQIILESYGNAHKYFQDNGREGLGLLILTGCFIEGLYLSTSVNIPTNERMDNLVAQQKFFLENIIELLGYYERSKDVALLIGKLNQLRKDYDQVYIKPDTLNSSLAIKSTIPNNSLENIKITITAIRNQLIG